MVTDQLSESDVKEFTRLLEEDLAVGKTESVVLLFQHNTTLYQTIGNLVRGGTMFVRLGVNMVLEELAETKPEEAKLALPQLIPLLSDENPTVRGDAADLIGIVGSKESIRELEPLLNDPHSQVVEVVKEAIEVLRSK